MAAGPEVPKLERPFDAFIVYNEADSDIAAKIDEVLRSRQISTYFWERDKPVARPWRETETRKLQAATAVVVLLGARGWGPNQLALASEARGLEKIIIPVLIGSLPPGAKEEAGALFRDITYVDLARLEPEGFDQLVKAIEEARLRRAHGGETNRDQSNPFANIISTLVDGSDDQRSDVLQQIVTSNSLDKPELAARLSDQIRSRFSPTQESDFNSAVRDPKKMASVRSWMLSCLIWADGRNGAYQQLLSKHVSSSFEHDQNVRFWTLAGLYQRSVSYLGSAAEICLSDPAPEVALLAQAIDRPNDGELVSRLQSMLASSEFKTAWIVLRLLRVVPIEGLVGGICEQLGRSVAGSPLSYDALYALANPNLTARALRILEKSPGVERLVAVVVEVGKSSDRRALRNFAMLLAEFQPGPIEATLASIESSDPASSDTIKTVRRLLYQIRGRDVAYELFVAGYAPDTIDVKHDYLNIRKDVQTLAAVMLAKEVLPPLAIGLFGDWGSGKSFFMKSMKAAAEKLAGEAKEKSKSKFCSAIVQVDFNAWHYVDANLWASLVEHIFAGLARYVSNELTPQQQLAKYIEELKNARSHVSKVEKEKVAADQEINKHLLELQTLQTVREQKQIELRDLRFPDLRKLLAEDTELKKKLDKSLGDLGIPAALTSISDLTQVISEVNSLQGRATAFFIGLLNAQSRSTVITLTIGLVTLPCLAAWLYSYLAHSFVIVGTIAAEGAVLVGGAVSFLRKAADYLKTRMSNLEAAKNKIDEILASKRQIASGAEMDLQKAIVRLKAEEEQTASRMRAVTGKVIDLEQRIAALQEGQSLTRFLSDRMLSDDYRKHLGLISTIRRDFDALTERVLESKNVERIILYIDDLDRCPADKVVDVLQAVHLLLAYPLFVVVVGVDPRWLSHALTVTYSTFKNPEMNVEKDVGSDLGLWRTTPQNYLEKIFQIPVSLMPMTDDGYLNLVRALFSPSVEAETRTQPSGSDVGQTPVGSPKNGAPAPNPATPSPAPPAVHPPPPASNESFIIHEEALTIRPVEAQFAGRLFELLPTPRATKRFSNIYRILKAPIAIDDLASFEGTEQVPGTFQVPMLLLAILIGMPDLAAVLFPQLYRCSRAGANSLLNPENLKIQHPTSQWEKLREILERFNSESSFPHEAKVFEDWLPRVSRFSFEIGRAVNPALVSGRALDVCASVGNGSDMKR